MRATLSSWRRLLVPDTHKGPIPYSAFEEFVRAHPRQRWLTSRLRLTAYSDQYELCWYGLARAVVYPDNTYELIHAVNSYYECKKFVERNWRRWFEPLFGGYPPDEVVYENEDTLGLRMRLCGYSGLRFDAQGRCLNPPALFSGYSLRQVSAALLLLLLRWCRYSQRDPRRLDLRLQMCFHRRLLGESGPAVYSLPRAQVLNRQLALVLRRAGLPCLLRGGALWFCEVAGIDPEQESALLEAAGELGRPTTGDLLGPAPAWRLQHLPDIQGALNYEHLSRCPRRPGASLLCRRDEQKVTLLHRSALRGEIPLLEVSREGTYRFWDIRSAWAMQASWQVYGNEGPQLSYIPGLSENLALVKYPSACPQVVQTRCLLQPGLELDAQAKLYRPLSLWAEGYTLLQVEGQLLSCVWAQLRQALSLAELLEGRRLSLQVLFYPSGNVALFPDYDSETESWTFISPLTADLCNLAHRLAIWPRLQEEQQLLEFRVKLCLENWHQYLLLQDAFCVQLC